MDCTLQQKKYKHFVSLGYFCSIAMDLDSFGLRDESLPFDWIISDSFACIIESIKNRFSAFLDYSQFYQSKKHPHI